MARTVTTLAPRHRQASARAYPVPSPRRPVAMPPTDRSNLGLWRWYRLPEVRKAANWTASGVSRVTFLPCVEVPGATGDRCPPLVNLDGTVADGVPERLARDAAALWSLVRSPMGGQADLWKSLSVSLQVAADAWLFAYPADEYLSYEPDRDLVWVSLARHAIEVRGSTYEVDVGTEGKVKVPRDEARAVRIWRPDPQRPAMADSWVTAAERDLERLEAIYEAVAAVALSRMHAGLILAPDDQDRLAPAAMATEQAEVALGTDLHQRLVDVLGDHVEAAAANLDGFDRAVPAVVGLNSELTDKVKWLELAREMDPELGKRIDDLRYRIAIAADAPPEMLLGLGDANHWNDEAVTTAEFQRSVQPDCELICDATTPHVLRDGLLAMGHGAADVAAVRVGYDASALVDPPDRSAIAGPAHDAGVLTDAEYRDATGLAEYAGPDDKEQRRRLVERIVIARPEYAHLLPLLDLPAPPEVAASEAAPPAEETDPPGDGTEATGGGDGPASSAATSRAASAAPDLGTELVSIAGRYEDRLDVLFGAIVDRMVERAASRVASLAKRPTWASVRDRVLAAPPSMRGVVPGVGALLASDGVDDDDLLGGALAAFSERFDTMTRRAQRQAVLAAGGDWDALEADAEQASAAAWGLAGSLLISEARRRFDGVLAPDGEGEGLGLETFAVPALLVRRVSMVAGGGQDPARSAVGGSAGPALSVATGPLTLTALAQAGTRVVAWYWDYRPELERAPFEDHLILHGTVEDGETPGDFDGWFPGDHAGCLCALRPITASGVGGDAVTWSEED